MSGYDIGAYRFDLSRYFPMGLFDRITEVRVTNPAVILKEARSRKKRAVLTNKGRLVILAADHPGRMVTKTGDDPIGMADRQQYLGRVLRVIANPGVDGVMATTDVIEDLFIVNHLVKEAGGTSFLDGKVILGSMNRGGLAGVEFEMLDTFTCFSVESIDLLNLDGAKLMFRLDITSRDSGQTMHLSTQAINELNRRELPIFLEPLYVTAPSYKMQKTLAEMVKIIGVASAMGDSSRNLWLKIPYGENYEKIVRATTLPLLMLGGESQGNPTGVLSEFASGIKAGANVRGALVGRNILFPGPDDPLAVALAVVDIIHGGAGAGEALAGIRTNRDREMDFFSRYF